MTATREITSTVPRPSQGPPLICFDEHSIVATVHSGRRHDAIAKPKLKVWVAFGSDLKFGDGRARLLELIDERGSLRQAAHEMAMSYRNAWGYLGELERSAGFRFVERAVGRAPRGGMRLTPEARRFLVRYRAFRSRLERTATHEFERVFGREG
jgi:molybdate transport system regulatory protein